MIISHKHKFIFIKTEKTAGTSIEIALSEICGPEDIITPISSKDEAYRQELGFRKPQNYLVPFSKYSKKDFATALFKRQRLKFYNHMDAASVKRYINDQQWKDYFKFTFERNPFDKIISWYYWNGGEKKYPTIMDFLNSGRAGQIKGFDLYTQNSRVVVDKVYKFEELNSALADISAALELKTQIQLPVKKTKSGVRKNKSHYREILSDFERSWMEKVFARELAFFDYKF